MSDDISKKLAEVVTDTHDWRVQDGWGRKNLSSRMIVVTMVFLMVGMLIGFFFGLPVPDIFWSSIIWASALIVVVYAIGPSALDQASKLASNIKGFR